MSNNDNFNVKRKSLGTNIYVSTGEVGFSFGSNTHPFRFLIPEILAGDNCKYIIYDHGLDLSTFPLLPELLSRYFHQIEVRDVDTYKYNSNDLIECHASQTSKSMVRRQQETLTQMCGFDYAMNLEDFKDIKKDKHYPKNLNSFLAKKASKIIFDKINGELP